MRNDRLEEIINTYVPNDVTLHNSIELYKEEDYEFTMLIDYGKVIGCVLDMDNSPHIFVLEKYRKNGYGIRLLIGYFDANHVFEKGNVVRYEATSDDGLNLIKQIIQLGEYIVKEIDERNYEISKSE